MENPMGKRTSIVFAIAFFGGSIFAANSQAQVTGEVRDGTVVLFASEPVAAAGLDFVSPAGRLTPVPDPPGASPFTFLLSNTANQITWGNLGSTITIDGSFNTNAGYVGDPAGDLTAAWGMGPTPVNIPISLVGDPLPIPEPPEPPQIPEPPVVVQPEIPPSPNGSNVFGEIREGTFILFSNEPTDMAGFDLQSSGGNLVPVDDRIGSAPFTFFLSNSANQITWGNLGTTVRLDGVLNMNAGFTGDSADDLQGFWGNGATLVAIPISLSDEPIPTGFESPVLPPRPDPPVNPPTPDPPTPDPPRPDPPRPPVVIPLPEPHNLPPTPNDGLVVGEVREETIVVIADEPVAVAGLDFVSQEGRIVPSPGTDASPFTFFLANNPNQVTFGNLGSNVTLVGELALSIGYRGDPDGDLTAAWGDGPRPVNLPITASDEPLPVRPQPPVVNPPVVDPPIPDPPVVNPPTDPVNPPRPNIGSLTGVINDDGFVVLIAGEPIDAAGIDLQSPAGNLIPVSEEIGAAPFTFFLSNTANQITWGNLGSTVRFDGEFVTGAGYNGEPEGDLLGFWGDGATPVAFAISSGGAVPVDPGPVIPEPTSLSLAWLAMLGVLGLRKSRVLLESKN